MLAVVGELLAVVAAVVGRDALGVCKIPVSEAVVGFCSPKVNDFECAPVVSATSSCLDSAYSMVRPLSRLLRVSSEFSRGELLHSSVPDVPPALITVDILCLRSRDDSDMAVALRKQYSCIVSATTRQLGPVFNQLEVALTSSVC